MKAVYSVFSSFVSYFFILVLLGSNLSLTLNASSRRFQKREVRCADGIYQHDTRSCCLCAIGQRLKTHCTAASPQDTQCEPCEPGTFNSHPNQDTTCKGCTSCSETNANLEVETPCTRARDAKCRCKPNHYCISANDQVCKLCSSCTECGIEGVKVACKATNDTVCNAKLQEKSHVAVAVVVVCAVAAVIFIAWCIRRNKKKRWSKKESSNVPGKLEVELEPINIQYTDPSRHLPAIASELGWKTMSNVAMRSGMNPVIIDNCVHDHPNDSEERTLQLLRKWVQEQGKGAMQNLIQILHNSKQNDTAQKVKTILSQN